MMLNNLTFLAVVIVSTVIARGTEYTEHILGEYRVFMSAFESSGLAEFKIGAAPVGVRVLNDEHGEEEVFELPLGAADTALFTGVLWALQSLGAIGGSVTFEEYTDRLYVREVTGPQDVYEVLLTDGRTLAMTAADVRQVAVWLYASSVVPSHVAPNVRWRSCGGAVESTEGTLRSESCMLTVVNLRVAVSTRGALSVGRMLSGGSLISDVRGTWPQYEQSAVPVGNAVVDLMDSYIWAAQVGYRTKFPMPTWVEGMSMFVVNAPKDMPLAAVPVDVDFLQLHAQLFFVQHVYKGWASLVTYIPNLHRDEELASRVEVDFAALARTEVPAGLIRMDSLHSLDWGTTLVLIVSGFVHDTIIPHKIEEDSSFVPGKKGTEVQVALGIPLDAVARVRTRLYSKVTGIPLQSDQDGADDSSFEVAMLGIRTTRHGDKPRRLAKRQGERGGTYTDRAGTYKDRESDLVSALTSQSTASPSSILGERVLSSSFSLPTFTSSTADEEESVFSGFNGFAVPPSMTLPISPIQVPISPSQIPVSPIQVPADKTDRTPVDRTPVSPLTSWSSKSGNTSLGSASAEDRSGGIIDHVDSAGDQVDSGADHVDSAADGHFDSGKFSRSSDQSPRSNKIASTDCGNEYIDVGSDPTKWVGIACMMAVDSLDDDLDLIALSHSEHGLFWSQGVSASPVNNADSVNSPTSVNPANSVDPTNPTSPVDQASGVKRSAVDHVKSIIRDIASLGVSGTYGGRVSGVGRGYKTKGGSDPRLGSNPRLGSDPYFGSDPRFASRDASRSRDRLASRSAGSDRPYLSAAARVFGTPDEPMFSSISWAYNPTSLSDSLSITDTVRNRRLLASCFSELAGPSEIRQAELAISRLASPEALFGNQYVSSLFSRPSNPGFLVHDSHEVAEKLMSQPHVLFHSSATGLSLACVAEMTRYYIGLVDRMDQRSRGVGEIPPTLPFASLTGKPIDYWAYIVVRETKVRFPLQTQGQQPQAQEQQARGQASSQDQLQRLSESDPNPSQADQNSSQVNQDLDKTCHGSGLGPATSAPQSGYSTATVRNVETSVVGSPKQFTMWMNTDVYDIVAKLDCLALLVALGAPEAALMNMIASFQKHTTKDNGTLEKGILEQSVLEKGMSDEKGLENDVRVANGREMKESNNPRLEPHQAGASDEAQSSNQAQSSNAARNSAEAHDSDQSHPPNLSVTRPEDDLEDPTESDRDSDSPSIKRAKKTDHRSAGRNSRSSNRDNRSSGRDNGSSGSDLTASEFGRELSEFHVAFWKNLRSLFGGQLIKMHSLNQSLITTLWKKYALTESPGRILQSFYATPQSSHLDFAELSNAFSLIGRGFQEFPTIAVHWDLARPNMAPVTLEQLPPAYGLRLKTLVDYYAFKARMVRSFKHAFGSSDYSQLFGEKALDDTVHFGSSVQEVILQYIRPVMGIPVYLPGRITQSLQVLKHLLFTPSGAYSGNMHSHMVDSKYSQFARAFTAIEKLQTVASMGVVLSKESVSEDHIRAGVYPILVAVARFGQSGTTLPSGISCGHVLLALLDLMDFVGFDLLDRVNYLLHGADRAGNRVLNLRNDSTSGVDRTVLDVNDSAKDKGGKKTQQSSQSEVGAGESIPAGPGARTQGQDRPVRPPTGPPRKKVAGESTIGKVLPLGGQAHHPTVAQLIENEKQKSMGQSTMVEGSTVTQESAMMEECDAFVDSGSTEVSERGSDGDCVEMEMERDGKTSSESNLGNGECSPMCPLPSVASASSASAPAPPTLKYTLVKTAAFAALKRMLLITDSTSLPRHVVDRLKNIEPQSETRNVQLELVELMRTHGLTPELMFSNWEEIRASVLRARDAHLKLIRDFAQQTFRGLPVDVLTVTQMVYNTVILYSTPASVLTNI